MEFRILGSLEVRVAGGPVPITAHKQRAVLAILLLRANEVASPECLIEGLWGSRHPASAPSLIKTYVCQLRKLLAAACADGGSRITTSSSGYSLRVLRDELDLARFEQLQRNALDALARGDKKHGLALLRVALRLWAGEPLTDTRLAGKLGAEVGALTDFRRTVLERRIALDMELGRCSEVIPELRVLIAEDPLCERWRAQLMRALYTSGRRAEALDVYQAARQTLVGELGVEPSAELQALQDALLHGGGANPAGDLTSRTGYPRPLADRRGHAARACNRGATAASRRTGFPRDGQA